jgi:hypothetical protein
LVWNTKKIWVGVGIGWVRAINKLPCGYQQIALRLSTNCLAAINKLPCGYQQIALRLSTNCLAAINKFPSGYQLRNNFD